MRLWYLAEAASIHTKKWVQFFARRGHEVSLFSYSVPGEPIVGVRLYLLRTSPNRLRLLSSLYNDTSSLLGLRQLTKQLRPDIVHAHYVTGHGFLGALLGFHPFVVTAWGSDILVGPRRSSPLRWVARYALRQADLITCDADHMSREMNKLGARSAKIRIVRFGVDTRKFSPKQISAATFRMPGESGYPTIISTRPLAPLYDTESLIRCAPLVLRDVADAKFLIVGKGPEERRLKELARSLAVAHRVTFLGSIPNDKLPQYLTSSDVYVSTCLSDAGISASTAEAMACGLPVIVTDVAENRKWVEDGVNGFLVPTRDPRMLAEKILYLAKNRDIASRFGALCRHIIEERNDYCKEMTKMEDLYEQLATRRG